MNVPYSTVTVTTCIGHIALLVRGFYPKLRYRGFLLFIINLAGRQYGWGRSALFCALKDGCAQRGQNVKVRKVVLIGCNTTKHVGETGRTD
jgi:hypothetical protein